MISWLRCVCFIVACGWPVTGRVDEGTVHPAVNEDPAGAPAGVRPYELDWSARHAPDHPQLVDFEDLSGWRTRCYDGAAARLNRSRQELLFGHYTARVEYTGQSGNSRFVIEPPEPIAIPGEFTAVNLWVRGNTWSFDRNQRKAMVGIAVLVLDAAGRTYRIPLDPNNHDYWFLSHKTCVSPDGASVSYQPGAPRMEFPAAFSGIEVTGVTNQELERLHFDALQFYVIAYPPLDFAAVPDALPWPTTPDTILPSLKAPTTVEVACGPTECAWTVAGDESLRFAYTPAAGTLGDIRVEARGQTFYPCWDGRISFDLLGATIWPGAEGVLTRCTAFEPTDDGCTAAWEIGRDGVTSQYTFTLRVQGKSLIVDVAAEGHDATRLDIGPVKGLNDAKTVYFPYLTYGDDWPKVVCSIGPQGPVFLWSAPDYYHSDASELFGAPGLRAADAVGYAGGAIYKPTTAGVRNPLRERIFINVSRDVQEVLPEIPNPPSDTGEIAKEYLWCNIGPAHQNELLTKFKAHEIDKFIACHHEVGWREAGESFTLRDRPADSIGHERLQAYSEFVRSLGYRFGTYTNYIDFSPVNANWHEDHVCLEPNGEWQRAWPRCYALKPLRAAELEAIYAPRIHARYGTNAQYCDVHTAYTPWGRTDYDARTPGAGMFRTQFHAYARLLWNESIAHHGPVFSEGNYHWFYAGIVDGNYATIMPYGEGWKQEPLVDFDLLKMHPKMTDFGMGFGEMYYGPSGVWRSSPGRLNPWFERFSAATIAFGHIGFLTYEWGFEATLKGYYMLQALQQRYAMVPVARIGYFNGEEILDTSTAIASDAYKRRHIHVEYENGLRLWVNLSSDLPWSVDCEGADYLLPPTGFLAHRDGDILAYSASTGGQPRHERVDCADYRYLDGRGTLVRTATVAAAGAVAIKPDGPGRWSIIPDPACGPVGIAREVLDSSPRAQFSAQAVDLADQPLGAAEVRHGAAFVTVMPVNHPQVVKYRLEKMPDAATTGTVEAVPDYMLPGETARARMRISSPVPTQDLRVTHVSDSGTETETRLMLENTSVTAPWVVDVPLILPPSDPVGDRAWFRCRTTESEPGLWIDVPVRPLLDVRFPAHDTLVHADQPLGFPVEITSNLRKTAEATITLTVDGVTLAPYSADLAPREVKSFTWELPASGTSERQSLIVDATWPDGSWRTRRRLRMQPEEWVVADLTQQSYTAGQCLRGEPEAPYDYAGTLAFVTPCQETLGGTPLSGLHMHPPYATKTGYVFATYQVALPDGRPRLDFALGFRSGSTTHDGCVFQVQVVHDTQQTTVFEEQYQTLDAWATRSTDLSAFAGEQVTIKLIADAGPADNTHSDWALWGAPRVVMADPMVRLHLAPSGDDE